MIEWVKIETSDDGVVHVDRNCSADNALRMIADAKCVLAEYGKTIKVEIKESVGVDNAIS